MKKIFFAVLALAAMASCSNEYTIDNQKQAIAFGEAFVDNGTRADYSDGTDKKVEEFLVYGTLKGTYNNTVQIFNETPVTRPTGLTSGYDPTTPWVCGVTQYWVPNTSYKFAAIVDGVATTTTGLPATIPFTVADGEGNLDLLYAEATASVNNNGTPSVSPVAFTFDHLLSKIGFTIDASEIINGYSIKVTGITVTGVAQDGTYTIDGANGAEGTWAQDGIAKTQLTFGADGTATRQILPVEQTLEVTINYDVYIGTTQISAATKSGKIEDFTPDMKTYYNITAEITATEIQFTVEAVNAWTPGSNITPSEN